MKEQGWLAEIAKYNYDFFSSKQTPAAMLIIEQDMRRYIIREVEYWDWKGTLLVHSCELYTL